MALSLLTTLWNRIDSTPASDIANGNGFGGFESEIFLQGTFGTGGSGGRKVDNNTRAYGVGPSALTAPVDLTNRHYCVYIGSNIWAGLTEVSGYNVDSQGQGTEGTHAYIDTGGTLITDGTESDIPSNNGWILLWVDPSRTEDGSTVGNPNIANTNFLGASWSGGNVGGGNNPNCFIDSLFISSTATQPGGYAFTGTATATPIEDLSSTEGNGQTGYQGTLFEVDGVYYFYARWYIGRTSEAAGTTATTFSESDRSIIFVSQRTVATDWSGWTVDLGNASTTFSLTNSNYQNSIVGDSGGGAADPTRRPDLQFIGTAGSATITNCAVLGLRLAQFTSAVTMTGGSLDVKDLNQSGATINGVDITCRVASGTALGTQADFTFGSGPGTLENCLIKQPGNNSYGHFVEFTSAGQSYDFNNLTFEGQYLGVTTGTITAAGTNDACIHNSSGGTVTINILDGSIPTVRNTNGSTTVLVQSFTISVTGLLGNSEVRVYDNPSLFTGGGSSVESTNPAGVETVSANTFVGDNSTQYLAVRRSFRFPIAAADQQTDFVVPNGDVAYELDPVGFVFSTAPGVLSDSISTLTTDDLVRITIRNDDVNPTLQNFLIAQVSDTPTANGIPLYGGAPNGSSGNVSISPSFSVGLTNYIGYVKTSYEYTVTVNSASDWDTNAVNCTITPSTGTSGDTATISFSGSTIGSNASATFSLISNNNSARMNFDVISDDKIILTPDDWTNLQGTANHGTLIWFDSRLSSGNDPQPNDYIITVEKVDASVSFTASAGTYDILAYRIGSLPITTKGISVNSIDGDASIPVSQFQDRVYKNPV